MKRKSSPASRRVSRPAVSPRLFLAHLAPKPTDRDVVVNPPLADDGPYTDEATIPAELLAPDLDDRPVAEPRDNLILASAYDGGITIELGPTNPPASNKWGFVGIERVTLFLDGSPYQTVTVEPADAENPFGDLKPDPISFNISGEDLGGPGEYRRIPFYYMVLFTDGSRSGPQQYVSVDTVAPAPGGSFPGKLRFSDDIMKNGITPGSFETDDDGTEYIKADVPGYVGKKAGDIIRGSIDGKVDPDDGDIGRVAFGEPDGPVAVKFPRSIIEEGGDGIKRFQYKIEGREGLESALSDYLDIPVLIRDFISDLDAPEVPAYDDDDEVERLIDEQDARDNLTVVIPPNAKSEVGMAVVVHWGGIPSSQVTIVDEADIRIVLDYAIPLAAWLAGNATGDDKDVPAEVTYDIYRDRVKLGSSKSHEIVANLHTAGGIVDPDPGTDPHDNFTKPVVRPASGASNDDSIPIGDADQDATVRIDKRGVDGKLVFKVGDTVIVHYGNALLDEREIESTDLDDLMTPLEITLPAGTIKAEGPGEQEVLYWTYRELANGGTNGTQSPSKFILVQTADALPGKGVLEALLMPELRGTAIGMGAIIDGTPVGIPMYENFSPDDEIVIYMPVYGAQHSPDEEALPGYGADDEPTGDQANRFVLRPDQVTITPPEEDQVVEPGGASRPGIKVSHIQFRIPADRFPGHHGDLTFHTHLKYRVTNAIGSVPSKLLPVLIDPRGTRHNSTPAVARTHRIGKHNATREGRGLIQRIRDVASAIEQLLK
jgi:hypothetical protein